MPQYPNVECSFKQICLTARIREYQSSETHLVALFSRAPPWRRDFWLAADQAWVCIWFGGKEGGICWRAARRALPFRPFFAAAPPAAPPGGSQWQWRGSVCGDGHLSPHRLTPFQLLEYQNGWTTLDSSLASWEGEQLLECKLIKKQLWVDLYTTKIKQSHIIAFFFEHQNI